jgi:hypothetical protein
MESLGYELINQRLDHDQIESAYYTDNQIFYCIEKTAHGEQVSFFNPEFAFEKQRLENADVGKLFTYLKAAEQHPEQHQQFLQKGLVFIKIDNSDLNRLVMHIVK